MGGHVTHFFSPLSLSHASFWLAQCCQRAGVHTVALCELQHVNWLYIESRITISHPYCIFQEPGHAGPLVSLGDGSSSLKQKKSITRHILGLQYFLSNFVPLSISIMISTKLVPYNKCSSHKLHSTTSLVPNAGYNSQYLFLFCMFGHCTVPLLLSPMLDIILSIFSFSICMDSAQCHFSCPLMLGVIDGICSFSVCLDPKQYHFSCAVCRV